MIDEVIDAVARWPEFAAAAGVSEKRTNDIAKHLAEAAKLG